MSKSVTGRLVIRSQVIGFTIIELLVVVVVIGILLAILLPAIGGLREHARQSTCNNNMRQLGLAIRNFEAQQKKLPPARTYGHDKYGNHNVLMFILPYMELDYISDNIDLMANWNSSSNESIAKQYVHSFICPSAPYRDPDDNYDVTDYTAAYKIDSTIYDELKGFGYGKDTSDIESKEELKKIEDNEIAALEEGLLGNNQLLPISAIRDGLENTIMLVERAGLPYKYERGERQPKNYTSRMRWAGFTTPFKIDEMYFDPSSGGGGSGWKIINQKNSQEIYSFHPEGAMLLYGDGTAKFVSEDLDPGVFANLFTRDGREVEFRPY